MKLIALRDKFWEYPYYFFIGRRSVAGQFTDFYLDTRPFSHGLFTIIIVFVLGVLMTTQLSAVLGFNNNTYVEGMIVGATPSGEPRGPSKLNPLQIVSTQLDRDIIEVVYEPLIRVDQRGNIVPVLAENYSEEKTDSGVSYRFSLRKNVKWHDGKDFTTEDVEATFNLIKELGSGGVPNVYAGASSQEIEFEVLDEYICRFTLPEGVLPNFFEVISFKIVQASQIDQYRDAFIRLTDAEELVTIGTGPFRLNKVEESDVRFVANREYYAGAPKIEKLDFKLFRDATEAVNYVKSGQVHGFANLNNEIISEVNDNSNFEVTFSDPIYTQYWGVYFNLSDSGSKILQDSDLRRAFSYAINRDLAVKTSLENAEVTYGTIPVISEYYSKGNQQPGYDREKALAIIKKEGWKLTEINDPITGRKVKVQVKGDERLEFSLAFVDNPDRIKLVDSIKADLAAVGIIVRSQVLQPQQLVNVRLNQDFDLLLFGVSTFVDPDRYEFFHSEQTVDNNGLNISSYKSTKTTTVIDQAKRETVRLPLADRLLDEGRKLTNEKERKETYAQFQQLLAEDIPVIFLYHPRARYLVSKRVRNVELTGLRSIEDRFHGIEKWEIVYE